MATDAEGFNNSNPSTPPAPWLQLPEESGAAWLAFGVYRDCGPARTVDGAYRLIIDHKGVTKAPRAPKSWRVWNKANRWRERARAWDARNEEVAQTSREDVIAREAAERQAQVEEQRVRETKLVAALYRRSMNLLTDPKVGGTIGEGVRAAAEAIRLGRLAIGMPDKATLEETETVIRFRPIHVPGEYNEDDVFR